MRHPSSLRTVLLAATIILLAAVLGMQVRLQQEIDRQRKDQQVLANRSAEQSIGLAQRILGIETRLADELQSLRAELATQLEEVDQTSLATIRLFDQSLKETQRSGRQDIDNLRADLQVSQAAIDRLVADVQRLLESAPDPDALSFEEARSQFNGIAAVLRDPHASDRNVIAALDRLPEVAVMEILIPVTDGDGEVNWQRTWPNLEESRELLVQWLKRDRVSMRLKPRGVVWHPGKPLTAEQVEWLEVEQPITQTLITSLSRFGPPDPEQPDHYWWNWDPDVMDLDPENVLVEAPHLREREVPAKFDPSPPRLDLRFVPADILEGVQLPWLEARLLTLPERVNLSGAVMPGVRIVELHAPWADLRGAHLENSRIGISSTNLVRADLENAVIDRCHWSNVNATGARLHGVSALLAEFIRCDFTSAFFVGTRLDGAFFRSSKLMLSSMSGASLRESSMTNTNVMGAQFIRADLSHATWDRVILNGATFNTVSADQFRLFHSDARGSHWGGAYLPAAIFNHVNLSSATMRYTRLSSATFNYCDLRGLDLSGAYLGARSTWLHPVPRARPLPGPALGGDQMFIEARIPAERTEAALEVTLPPVMLVHCDMGPVEDQRMTREMTVYFNRERAFLREFLQHVDDQPDLELDPALATLLSTVAGLPVPTSGARLPADLRLTASDAEAMRKWFGDEVIVHGTRSTVLHHTQPYPNSSSPEPRLLLARFDTPKTAPMEENMVTTLRLLLLATAADPEVAAYPRLLDMVRQTTLEFEAKYQPTPFPQIVSLDTHGTPWRLNEFHGYQLMSLYEQAARRR